MPNNYGLFGQPPSELASWPPDASQFSPLSPGSPSLEECAPGTMSGFTLRAPPGTIERKHTLALALRALAPDAPLTALAPKDKGGSRIKGELEQLGCEVQEEGKAHHRICVARRPAEIPAWASAIQEGEPRFDQALGLWTQPGVFSWNRVDEGSAMLLKHLPKLSGRGLDLGCGLGILAKAALTSQAVKQLTLLDIDRRAVACAQRNIMDSRCRFHWADLRTFPLEPASFDFVLTNPPFHDGGEEDQSLGITFLQESAKALKSQGVAWIVANRHLPYENALQACFRTATLVEEGGGFKIYQARK